jgi:hypothetical protein
MADMTYPFAGTNPLGSNAANEIDEFIREGVKLPIMERFELEHQPLDSATIDEDDPEAAGRHKPGIVGVLFIGTSTERGALSGMGAGAFAYETDTGYFKYYDTSDGWKNLPSVGNALVAGDGIRLVGSNNAVSIGTEVPVPGVMYSVPAVLTDASSIVVDASRSNVFTLTIGGNRTLANPSNLKTGCMYMFVITQDATGSRSLSYGSAYTFVDSVEPVLTTAAGAVDILSAYYDGSKPRCTMLNNFG